MKQEGNDGGSRQEMFNQTAQLARNMASEAGHVAGTVSHDMATTDNFAQLRRDQIAAQGQSDFETVP